MGLDADRSLNDVTIDGGGGNLGGGLTFSRHISSLLRSWRLLLFHVFI